MKTVFLPKRALRILHLEDSAQDAELVSEILRGAGLFCEITCARTREAFESNLAAQTFDLILCDYGLPGYDGFAALQAVRTRDRNIPLILLSGGLGEEQAVESLKSGATDYLLKSRLERLVPAVTRALREAQERAIRRKAEEALAKEREFIKAVLENTEAGIMACDGDGNLTLFNRAARQMCGRAEEAIPPEQWAEHYHFYAADGTRLLQTEEIPLFRAFQGERVQDSEVVIAPAEGVARRVLCSGQPILDGQSKPVGAVVVLHDVTERRKAEEEARMLENQLRQAQKLEAIGTLAGGIAHDFNNILGAIIGYTELAQEDMTAEHRSKRHLQEVLKAGHRAKELVRQILAFSRQSIPERKPVAIGMIIKEALKLLRATLPTTIQIRTDINSRNDRVVADPVQIHQVLMNLCTNAGYAMREKGGTLTVSLNQATVAEEPAHTASLPPGAYLKLSVQDTGHGMAKDVLDRVFDPFFTTKPLGEGTGLGLSVVHGIVTSHGGQISVRSEPDVGTTFDIVLPQTPNVIAMPAQDRPEVDRGTERVLLVDDEAPLANLLWERLERCGYQVVAQTDSVAAFEIFLGAPSSFDIVITDQTMPGMTGIELAKRLRQVRGDIPIVLCTGYSESMREEDVRAIGLCEVVLKPVDLHALHAAVRRVLDRKEAIAC